MSFNVESFVNDPSIRALSSLKRTELTQVAERYELTVTGSMKKAEVRQLIVSYLREEELVSDNDEDTTDNSAVSLKKLELQERAKEREAEVKLKELQLREKELEMQLRLKELEVSWVSSSSDAPVWETTVSSSAFDVSKHIKFVPSFSEMEVDKYFSHFKKAAQSLKWPKDAWTLLLQSGLVGKACAVYSALSVEDSGQYEVVKMNILNAYKLVPEAYRQKFRNTKKTDKQTYVEFGREKDVI